MDAPTTEELLKSYRHNHVVEVITAEGQRTLIRIDEEGQPVVKSTNKSTWIPVDYIQLKAPLGGKIRILGKLRTEQDVKQNPIVGDIICNARNWEVCAVTKYNVVVESTDGWVSYWPLYMWRDITNVVLIPKQGYIT